MVSRTYNTIIDAFNRLIAEKDFNKISVEMIMEKAGISRSTFYRSCQKFKLQRTMLPSVRIRAKKFINF